MPFAANRQVGKTEGVKGQGGSGVGSGGGRSGQDVDFCSAATQLATIFALLLHIFTMHNVSGFWQRCVKCWNIGKGHNRS